MSSWWKEARRASRPRSNRWDGRAWPCIPKRLGKMGDFEMFLNRAHSHSHVFDLAHGFVHGKTADGKWISPFDRGYGATSRVSQYFECAENKAAAVSGPGLLHGSSVRER